MNNEPVAWINQNIDIENGKPQLAWNKDNFAEICKPLYTHPADAEKVKENMDKVLKQNERLIEALANARITFDAEIEKKNTMLKMWEATHPAKTLTDDPLVNFKPIWQEKPELTLTDEEINKLWAESHEDGIAMQQGFTTQQNYFAHLILRKAQEK